jgi:hypothetical protein
VKKKTIKIGLPLKQKSTKNRNNPKNRIKMENNHQTEKTNRRTYQSTTISKQASAQEGLVTLQFLYRSAYS